MRSIGPTQRFTLRIPGKRDIASQEGLEPEPARLATGEDVALERGIEECEAKDLALVGRCGSG